MFSSLYRAFEGVFSVFILAGVIALILGPFLLVRLMGLKEALPQWIKDAGDQLQGFSERAAVIGIDLDIADVINTMVANVTAQLDGFVLGIPAAILGSIGNFLGIFFLNVLTIFFLIYGGELVRNCLLSWLPEERGLRVLFVLRQNFNSFIFNQVVLAVVLASALSITLVLLGAPFPFLTGISIGLMGFIPFGAIVGVLVFSLLFMLKGFWLGLRVFAVLILVDQFIENVLPPRLLGKLTGLNPIVILFSVMVGATLAGFVGIITAVPIAATVKELFLVPAPPSLGAASAASAASAD